MPIAERAPSLYPLPVINAPVFNAVDYLIRKKHPEAQVGPGVERGDLVDCTFDSCIYDFALGRVMSITEITRAELVRSLEQTPSRLPTDTGYTADQLLKMIPEEPMIPIRLWIARVECLTRFAYAKAAQNHPEAIILDRGDAANARLLQEAVADAQRPSYRQE